MARTVEVREKKLQELLSWAAAISGLPIRSIAQCQNGAVFCILTAVACSPNDVQLSQVDFEARTESECRENYIILRHLASVSCIAGLNMDAGLSSWMRMARSKTDAQHYLKLLRRSLPKLRLSEPSTAFEAEATAPPAPCFQDKSDNDTMHSTWLHSRITRSDSSSYCPSDFGFRMPSGSLELELQQQFSSELPEGLFPSQHSSSPSTPTFGRSDSNESITHYQKLEKAFSSSTVSSLEAFMFPEDAVDVSNHIRQSLQAKKSARQAQQPPKLYVPRLLHTTSNFSGMSSWTDLEGFKTPVAAKREVYPPMAQPILEMIKDLDLMIQELDQEKEEKESNIRNAVMRSCAYQELAPYTQNPFQQSYWHA